MGEGNQWIAKFPEPRIPDANHGKGREEEDAIRQRLKQHPNSGARNLLGGYKMPEHWVGGREGEISASSPLPRIKSAQAEKREKRDRENVPSLSKYLPHSS